MNVFAGSSIGWEYTVTNTGNVGISNVTVSDDNGTSTNTGDDFTAIYRNGDANGNNILDVGETWVYNASGKSIEGAYTNISTALAPF